MIADCLLLLLLQEPRLLMPSSSAITHNYAAICSALDITPGLLNRWVSVAPMLLLVPGATLRARLSGLLQVLFSQVVKRGVPDLLEKLLIVDGTVPAAAAAAGDGNIGFTAAAVCGHRQLISSTPNPPGVAPDLSAAGSEDNLMIRPADDQQQQQQQAHWELSFSDTSEIVAYVTKDPRVLLLNPEEIAERLHVVQQELHCR
jgi:hypothetical protein